MIEFQDYEQLRSVADGTCPFKALIVRTTAKQKGFLNIFIENIKRVEIRNIINYGLGLHPCTSIRGRPFEVSNSGFVRVPSNVGYQENDFYQLDV